MALTAKQAETLRHIFKFGNRFMVGMWKTGLFINPYPPVTGQIMMLVHTGRRTGKKRITPVNYAVIDDTIYCTAGFGKIADWYKNIMVKPEVEAWLPGEKWKCTAGDVTDTEYATWYMREVLKASGFAAPLFGGIHPYTITEGEIREVTEGYRLIRLQKVEKIPGKFEGMKYLPVAAGLLALGIALRLRERGR